MKFLCSCLFALSLTLILGGCVDVDKQTAGTPRTYWTPPSKATPRDPLAVSPAQPGLGNTTVGAAPLDLVSLVDIALSNNPRTRQAWYQAKAAAGLLGETNSQYYPQLTVGANITRTKNRGISFNTVVTGTGTTYSTYYGPTAEINWVLWNFGQNYALTEASRQALYAANFQYNQAIQDVILATELAYFNFNAGIGFVDASKATLADANISYQAASQKLQNGLGTKQATLQALAQVKNAEFQLEQSQAQVETARSQLANALGIVVSAELQIVPNQLPIEKAALMEQEVSALMAVAMRQRPNLMAAYANMQAAHYDLEAARAGRWPVISAVGSAQYGYGSGDTQGNPLNVYQAGIQVSWELFTGFNRTYAIITAQQQEKALRETLRTQELQAISDVWNYFYGFKSAERQVESTTAAVTAQLEAYNAIQVGYDNGLNTYVELLTAQSNLATARQQKVQADANLGTAIANLAHATGSLPLEPYAQGK